MSARRAALSVRRVSISFGGLMALHDVTLDVLAGECVGLIGPNGAGKTTLFNVLTRLYRPDEGEAFLGDRDLLALAPHEVAAAGIARTFQNLLVFGEMTVLENVLVGLHVRTRAGLLSSAFRTPRARIEERAARDRALEALALVGLDGVAGLRAGALPFGHQRLLELARAVVSRPQLLLLDEPGAGLNASELDRLAAVIGRIRGMDELSVLLVGHTLRLVFGLSERVVVLDHGVKIAEGRGDEVKADPDVVAAYLGKPADAAS